MSKNVDSSASLLSSLLTCRIKTDYREINIKSELIANAITLFLCTYRRKGVLKSNNLVYKPIIQALFIHVVATEGKIE